MIQWTNFKLKFKTTVWIKLLQVLSQDFQTTDYYTQNKKFNSIKSTYDLPTFEKIVNILKKMDPSVSCYNFRQQFDFSQTWEKLRLATPDEYHTVYLNENEDGTEKLTEDEKYVTKQSDFEFDLYEELDPETTTCKSCKGCVSCCCEMLLRENLFRRLIQQSFWLINSFSHCPLRKQPASEVFQFLGRPGG